MSANVETMFSVREKPWHGLGQIIQEAPTSADALKLAGLDWTVESRPVFQENNIVIPDYKANVRTSDNTVLGIVGGRYQIVQNSEAFSFTDALVGEGCKYETAGSLRNGKQIWLLAQMPKEKILGDDVIPYLCFTNSHDGSSPVQVCMTPVRVVCNNTLNLALRSANRKWKTRHTGDMEAKIHEAKITLGLANHYMDSLADYADRAANQVLSEDELQTALNALFPISSLDNKRSKNNKQLARDTFMNCLYAPDVKDFIGTKWGAINAMADMVDHAPSTVKRKDERKQTEGRFETIVIDGHAILDAFTKLMNVRTETAGVLAR